MIVILYLTGHMLLLRSEFLGRKPTGLFEDKTEIMRILVTYLKAYLGAFHRGRTQKFLGMFYTYIGKKLDKGLAGLRFKYGAEMIGADIYGCSGHQRCVY